MRGFQIVSHRMVAVNILAVALSLSAAGAARPEFGPVTANATRIGQYEKFELTFTLDGSFDNPFAKTPLLPRVTPSQPNNGRAKS